MSRINLKTYWRTQIRRTILLLIVWFIVGYVMSIFLIGPLNEVSLGGLPFGFWMAQQGSIFVFVILIFIYAVLSGRLDEDAGVTETNSPPPPPHD